MWKRGGINVEKMEMSAGRDSSPSIYTLSISINVCDMNRKRILQKLMIQKYNAAPVGSPISLTRLSLWCEAIFEGHPTWRRNAFCRRWHIIRRLQRLVMTYILSVPVVGWRKNPGYFCHITAVHIDFSNTIR